MTHAAWKSVGIRALWTWGGISSNLRSQRQERFFRWGTPLWIFINLEEMLVLTVSFSPNNPCNLTTNVFPSQTVCHWLSCCQRMKPFRKCRYFLHPCLSASELAADCSQENESWGYSGHYKACQLMQRSGSFLGHQSSVVSQTGSLGTWEFNRELEGKASFTLA